MPPTIVRDTPERITPQSPDESDNYARARELRDKTAPWISDPSLVRLATIARAVPPSLHTATTVSSILRIFAAHSASLVGFAIGAAAGFTGVIYGLAHGSLSSGMIGLGGCALVVPCVWLFAKMYKWRDYPILFIQLLNGQKKEESIQTDQGT